MLATFLPQPHGGIRLFREHPEARRSTGADQDDAQLGTSLRLAPDVIDPLLELDVRQVGRGVTIGLKGDLDLSTVFELREVLAQILSECAPQELILDLLELDYVDSTGLSVFLLAHERARASGFRFALAYPNSFIARLLELSTPTSIIEVITLPAPAPQPVDPPPGPAPCLGSGLGGSNPMTAHGRATLRWASEDTGSGAISGTPSKANRPGSGRLMTNLCVPPAAPRASARERKREANG